MSEPNEQPTIEFVVDGVDVSVPDDGASLLGTLRDRLGNRSPKDGCSPQGQCGCCTVLVDGQPRVACVTPTRRVAGRTITTLDGFPEEEQQRWANAFCATGASQCGFCTPGIIVRLAGLEAKKPDASKADVDKALAAHMCRCTGWQTIHEAWELRHDPPTPESDRPDPYAAAFIAPTGRYDPSALDVVSNYQGTLEGRTLQSEGPHVALGRGGFADDFAPADALVAVRNSAGEWIVAETLHAARQEAGKVQGRRTTLDPSYPLEVPAGNWNATLQTTWTEPGYLETDASWAFPDAGAANPDGNGGSFGAKWHTPVAEIARELSAEHGRPVRVLFSREDTVRLGPKRPPVAGGAHADGTGLLRIAAPTYPSKVAPLGCESMEAAIALIAPGLDVELVELPNSLTTSESLRGAGWVEAWCLLAMARGHAERLSVAEGTWAEADVDDSGIRVRVGAPVQTPAARTTIRSYCIGAAHMATSLVRSESLAVDEHGEVHDLTIRSFGILKAADTPPIDIEIVETDQIHESSVSDLVFAAVAAATCVHLGASRWPHDG